MIEVKRKKGESFEAMLRRFSQRVQSSGTALEVRKRKHFTKKPTHQKLKASALNRQASRVKRAYLEKVGLLVEDKKKKFGRR